MPINIKTPEEVRQGEIVRIMSDYYGITPKLMASILQEAGPWKTKKYIKYVKNQLAAKIERI